VRRVDIATGVFFIALGGFAITQSLELDFVSRGGGPGPGLYPMLLAVALTVLGGALIINRLLGRPEQFGAFDWPAAPELTRVVLVMAAVAVSIALLPFAGYFLSTLALVAALLFGVERLRSWRALLTTIALPAIFFFLFVVLLRVRLPSGFVDL
jgi:putative tricarboxylic transport membrane protein